jgi:Ca2+-binding RTX toxin-like protein
LYIPSDTGAGYSWTKAPPTPTYDGSNNLGIAFGAVIENAIGGSGDDTIWGNSANNRLQGNGGINTLDGGDGVDTAVYTGNFSDYTITAANGSYVVAAKASWQTDRITHIERLAFKDATLALGLAGLAEDTLQAQYAALAQKFYVAYFGRPADAAGLASMVAQFTAAGVPASTAAFVDAYRSNAVVKALIDSFGNSAESAALYHGSNREFVTAVYDNLLGRAPDLDGLNFWTAGVDAGLARGVAVLNMVAGAEGNQTAQGLIDAALLTNRVTVASNFTGVLDTPAEVAKYAGAAAAAAARSLLDGVDHNTSILNYESSVLNLVAQLPAGTAAQLVGVQTAGHDGWLA